MRELPSGFTLRGPTLDDAIAATEVIVADDLAETGRSLITPSMVRNMWAAMAERLATDAWLVYTPDGACAAYGRFHLLDAGPCIVRDSVHPRYRGQGIGSYLLDRAEQCAHRYAQRRPDQPVVMQVQSRANHAPGQRLMERNGFERVRRFWDMLIALDGELSQPQWPAGVALAPFDLARDGRALHAAVAEAFADHWEGYPVSYEEWLQIEMQSATQDPSLVLVAKSGDDIIGGVNCLADDGQGYLSSVFVRRPWRGQGVALALLRHAFRELRRIGCTQAGLQVDSQNPTGATQLYERAGMHTVDTLDFYEKVVTP